MKKSLITTAILLACSMLIQCETTQPKVQSAAPAQLKEIQISPKSPSVYVGSTIELTANGIDINGNPIEISPTWEMASKYSKIATFASPKVSGPKAVLTGIRNGSVMITVSQNGVSKAFLVKIEDVTPEKVKASFK